MECQKILKQLKYIAKGLCIYVDPILLTFMYKIEIMARIFQDYSKSFRKFTEIQEA